jgi:hypothetical protein
MNLIPEFQLKQAVFFMRNNRVKKSTITSIKYPTVWLNKKGQVEQTLFIYRVKSMTSKDYGNSEGIPSCLLFKTKKDLLKSL